MAKGNKPNKDKLKKKKSFKTKNARMGIGDSAVGSY